ncbi:uncharacterized protein BDV14DRAFT_197934 [Aspergillus stella-maris]|uniref:uncharacterized protein n=1 Tax=Aspergillus stella-maris TaxID=1810926 RepID=UPI003CCD7DD7
MTSRFDYTYSDRTDPASDTESQASADFDPKLLLERDRMEEKVRLIFTDDKTTYEQKVKSLATKIAQAAFEKEKYQRDAEEYEVTNQELREQNHGLTDDNYRLNYEERNDKEKIQKLQGQLEAAKAAEAKAAEKARAKAEEDKDKVIVEAEKIREMEDAELQMKQLLAEREKQLLDLQRKLETAGTSHDTLTVRLVEQSEANAVKAKQNQQMQDYLSAEMNELKKRMAEFNEFMAALHAAEAQRTEELRKEQEGREKEEKERLEAMLRASMMPNLATGIIDEEMQDTWDTDAKMETWLPHDIPKVIRVRRRVAKPKIKVTRAGSSKPRAARPAELRKGYSEQRAASTYLQYKDGRKENFKALKVVGRSNGIPNSTPRKRTRLQKGSDLARRAEKHLEELVRDAGCRGLARPRNLGALPETLKRRISPNPYDKRNDKELACLMQGISMKPEKSRPLRETQQEAHLVTITKTVQPFIARPNILSHPRYLPKHGREVTQEERRQWSKKASTWSLGPGERKKLPNKIVRFAEKVEYEPEKKKKKDSKEWDLDQEPTEIETVNEKAPGWSFNWTHLIIAFLLFLLFASNMGPEDSRGGWQNANTRPDDIVAKLRSSGQAGAKPTIIDFEVARWSDVDPSIYG